jgi:hypothetical protein
MDIAIHIAKAARHILDDPCIFFLSPSEMHAAFPVDCSLVTDGLGEPVLIPAVSIGAGARSG